MLLTVKSAAQRLCISQSLLYELCASGSLPHVRITRPGSRGIIRIDAADLDGFVASQKIVCKPQARKPPAKPVFRHVVLK